MSKHCATCAKTNLETRPFSIAKLRGTDPPDYEQGAHSFSRERGIRSDLDAAQAWLYIILDRQALLVNRKNPANRKHSGFWERRRFARKRMVSSTRRIELNRGVLWSGRLNERIIEAFPPT